MTKFNVPDMSCGHCTATIKTAISALDATAEVAADLPSNTVDIDSSLAESAVLDALKKAGYEATVAG